MQPDLRGTRRGRDHGRHLRLVVVRRDRLNAPTDAERMLRRGVVEAARERGIGSPEYLAALLQLFPLVQRRLSRPQLKRYLTFVVDLLTYRSTGEQSRTYLMLKQLAWHGEEIGCYSAAERCYLRAIAAVRGMTSEDCENRARVLKSLSSLYFKWGKQKEAIARAREAHAEIENVFGASLRDRIEVIAHLGSLLGAVNQGEEGILYLVSALTLSESCETSYLTLQADIADRIAEIAESLGERTRAFAYARLSRKVRMEIGQLGDA